MKNIIKKVSKGLLAALMVLAITPSFATSVFAEDTTKSTTTVAEDGTETTTTETTAEDGTKTTTSTSTAKDGTKTTTTTTVAKDGTTTIVETIVAKDGTTKTNTTKITATTSTAAPTPTVDPKTSITVDSDKIVVDASGTATEQKESTVETDGTSKQTVIVDQNNTANVVTTKGDSTNTVTIDANGNPQNEKTTSTTKSETETTTDRVNDVPTTTTTTTDTTTKTTVTTTVDQNAIDEAGRAANIANTMAAKYTPISAVVDGVTYTVYQCDAENNKLETLVKSPDHYELDFVIGANAEGDQTINISSAAIEGLSASWDIYLHECANKYYHMWGFENADDAYAELVIEWGTAFSFEPGDGKAFVVNVTAANGVKHTYQYKDSSFVLTTGTTTVTEQTDTGAVGYDGNTIPANYAGGFASSDPMRALFGKTGTAKIELLEKLNVYDALAKLDYTTEKFEYPLTAYILNYYSTNEKYKKADGTAYSSMEELLKECPAAVVNMQAGGDNGWFSISTTSFWDLYKNNAKFKAAVDGPLAVVNVGSQNTSVQFKWPEAPLISASYNYFYADLAEVDYSDTITNKQWSSTINSKSGTAYGLAGYADKNGTLYTSVNDYLNSTGTISGDSDSSINLNLHLGVNGPLTTNSYQMLDFSFVNSISLEQVDGSLSVNKVDTEGNEITDNQTGYNLYYITGQAGAEQTMYYALDKNGNGYFTADLTKAALLMTVNGNLNVQYLLPNTYYLQEVIAPEGYYINKTALEVEVQSGKIATANFTDVAPIITTSAVEETTVKQTVTTSTLVTPLVPDTPVEPETPTVPERPEAPTTPEVVERPVSPSTPNTGDQTNAGLFGGALSVSVVLAIAAYVLKKKYYD